MAVENVASLVQWQYQMVTKQTENYLLPELNELGKGGWESVSASYNKDYKGIWGWTAWLKRPLSAAAASDSAAAAAVAPGITEQPPLAGFEMPDGDFQFKD